MAGLNDAPMIRIIAVPSVILLISFLSYFSQLVFHYSTLDPGPPSRSETYKFNTLLLFLWFTYYKTVTTDPGRYVFRDKVIDAEGKRWCKKCEAPKPPRAHHCRICSRCVPKMDHHCPWTGNCVSMTTFPHFLRFLLYANLSLWYLGHLLWQRVAALWESRHLPAYLGPSVAGLASLAIIGLIWFVTSTALGIMLITSSRSWVMNQTSIEGWELEKHENLMDRSQREWWDVKGPDGKNVRFERTEFPYDVGFFTNMAQAMGTKNPLWWFFPLAGSPKVGPDDGNDKAPGTTGWTWPENGFNRVEGMWPPPDPEKLRQARREWPAARRNFATELKQLNDDEEVNGELRKEQFRRRQEEDVLRKRRALYDDLEDVDYEDEDNVDEKDYENEAELAQGQENGYGDAGRESSERWKNEDGDTLHDFGVDTDAEGSSEDEEEDVPIGELIRRRKARKPDEE